jgi:hypothetical protein
VLCCFKSTNAVAPACRAWLDGARAEDERSEHALQRTGGRHPAQVELKLHRKHAVPSGAHATGTPQTGYSLHFRPDALGPAGAEAFKTFMLTVNNKGYPPGGGAAGAAGAAGGTSSSTHSQARPVHSAAPAAAPDLPPNPNYSPLAHGAGRVPLPVSPADAQLARRLQEEEDAAFARRLQNLPSIGRTGSGAAAAGAAAAAAGARPPITQPSQDVGIIYPTIRFDTAPPTPSSSASQPAPTNLARPVFGTGAPAAAAAAAAAGSASSAGVDAEDTACCVCLDAQIEVGFLHGST